MSKRKKLTAALTVFSAAALLLTPGILTDAIGFFLLVPLTRRWIVVLIRKRIRFAEGAADGAGEPAEPRKPPPSTDPGGGKIIDQDGNIVG